MTRHALVVHTRMPAFDRDSGSQVIDHAVRFLLDSGWSVTFVSQEEEHEAEARHAQRLRQMGVPTYAGLGWIERIVRSGDFDLTLVTFWNLAEKVIPVIREHSPGTRIVIHSIDLHFLRLARGAFGQHERLDQAYGADTARELNAYDAADAVIAVSDKERDLLGEFLGPDRVLTVPLAESMERSPVALEHRRGMFFVGNFRHLPNREAVEFMCHEVLPQLDPELLDAHPLTVVGNHLHQVSLDVDPEIPGVNLVGWVPSVRPYLDRSRISVVPLLNGAGVKGKVIQSMMAYTPVVTTTVGAEGLDLVQGEHALIAADAGDLAAGISRLLTDDDLWFRLAEAGAAHVDARHGMEHVRKHFDDLVTRVLERPVRSDTAERRFTGVDAATEAEAVRERIQMVGAIGAVVLVASGGDDELVDVGSHPCWHFPQGRDGGWAGFDPVDGRAAVTHLEAQRARGARYLVLPRQAFSWRYRYPELIQHLEQHGRRVHDDDHLQMWDLEPERSDPLLPAPTPSARVQVIGRYRADRAGPPLSLRRELQRSAALTVDQDWRPDHDEPAARDPAADYVVHVSDDAVVSSGFLDALIATHVALDVDRVQPTHRNGPGGAPPITERHRGSVAREVDTVVPLPVLSVRAGAPTDGPTVLADTVTIGLRHRISDRDSDRYAQVRRMWVPAEGGGLTCHLRPDPPSTPRISVLISTYQRPELLRAALESFADQTLARDEFEVVVVDDGSDDSIVGQLESELGDRLQIIDIRIGHAGRSAAKNHCVLLARAPIVLFFDDDDRARPDYLERHLAAHDAHADEATAILGHTDWAPELELTPLMHFITDVDRLMFAYERLEDGQELDWRGFWEGRISCKRSLLMRHGLHDQRLNYSIDVEMAWRLAPRGLRVVYDASAVSVMARPLDADGFCDRTQAKGRANAVIAALHRGTEVADRLRIDEALADWDERRFTEAALRRRMHDLERRSRDDRSLLSQLHDSYREVFRLLNAKGIAEATGGVHAMPSPPTTVHPFEGTDPDLVHDGSPAAAADEPALSVSIPVWSRSPELAAMAQGTIERIWEVARVPTEVIAVDNGSPHEVPLAAKVYRYPENKGVATGWNTGIRLSTAPVVAVLNSDCRVEPGWDEALLEAATDGRRIAFPYTDHCDGLGFTRPDQGGTAGWCFVMTRAIYDEVGPFDEWFNPAFLEDTDYWHRAWEMGIELTPVPAARVIHARRTTASTHPHVDWLLQGHRYKYGWKHGVDPHRAPPYYDREIVEYVSTSASPER